MAQIISLHGIRNPCPTPALRKPRTISAATDDDGYGTAVGGDGQHLPAKEDIFRAILLLDLAAQQARLLVKEVTDQPRRDNLSAQIATIEHMLQLARDMALKL